MPAYKRHWAAVEAYNLKVENSAAAATGALSLEARTSLVAVDGTDARTLGAPRFKGQYKTIKIVSGANTPILNITVTGMRNTTQNVWTMATFDASTGPRSLTLYSPDGVAWDEFATVGTVTVA